MAKPWWLQIQQEVQILVKHRGCEACHELRLIYCGASESHFVDQNGQQEQRLLRFSAGHFIKRSQRTNHSTMLSTTSQQHIENNNNKAVFVRIGSVTAEVERRHRCIIDCQRRTCCWERKMEAWGMLPLRHQQYSGMCDNSLFDRNFCRSQQSCHSHAAHHK